MEQSYYRAIPSTDPAFAEQGLLLAGGWVRFREVERLTRSGTTENLSLEDVPQSILDRLTAPRPPIAGVEMRRPSLMGILNVTPDSFSDGGRHDDLARAVTRVEEMLGEGADLIDIGGESTRPGAALIPEDVEIARVFPVIKALRSKGGPCVISLDTRKSAVGEAGLNAGAQILNDVSGLRFDPKLAQVAAQAQAPLILMHSIADPETMQDKAPLAYDDVLFDVYDGLAAAIEMAEAQGVARHHIMVDPGIGFGKTLEQNTRLLRRISLFHSLGCGILLGVSRKGMIGALSGETNGTKRGPGSAAVGLWAIAQGIQMLRVHDIALHKQAVDLWRPMLGGDLGS